METINTLGKESSRRQAFGIHEQQTCGRECTSTVTVLKRVILQLLETASFFMRLPDPCRSHMKHTDINGLLLQAWLPRISIVPCINLPQIHLVMPCFLLSPC